MPSREEVLQERERLRAEMVEARGERRFAIACRLVDIGIVLDGMDGEEVPVGATEGAG
jgi:hypothetical protein